MCYAVGGHKLSETLTPFSGQPKLFLRNSGAHLSEQTVPQPKKQKMNRYCCNKKFHILLKLCSYLFSRYSLYSYSRACITTDQIANTNISRYCKLQTYKTVHVHSKGRKCCLSIYSKPVKQKRP